MSRWALELYSLGEQTSCCGWYVLFIDAKTDLIVIQEIPNVHRMLIDKISKAFIAGHVLITNLER